MDLGYELQVHAYNLDINAASQKTSGHVTLADSLGHLLWHPI